jgi:hypothetical protein
MKPHGFVELEWKQKILFIKTYGPFNLEGISAASTEINGLITQQNHNHWLRLDSLDDETLGSPEVMKVIAESYRWSLNHGCNQIVVCCYNQIQMALLNQFISRSGLNVKAFSCIDLAWQYANKQIID